MDFELPNELIAKSPAVPRDSARLLVYNRISRQITDSKFSDLPEFLNPNTTLVLNNSKVEHCRWLFCGGIEIFVLQKLDTNTITAMVRKGKKFKVGSSVWLTDWLQVKTLAIDSSGIRTLQLNVPHDNGLLKPYEHVPLPPYMPQNDALANEYQTVYAKPLGSKAAPTAGLHFTPALIDNIAKKYEVAKLTLHVGLGTFAPLTEQQLASGHLHKEFFSINQVNAKKVMNATHITAVGTTTVRTLETLAKINKLGVAIDGSTDILIKPPYDFKKVDSMITNFHLPGTSLLLLVGAFVGDINGLERVYKHAIKNKYRFYSFGDAMLIL